MFMFYVNRNGHRSSIACAFNFVWWPLPDGNRLSFSNKNVKTETTTWKTNQMQCDKLAGHLSLLSICQIYYSMAHLSASAHYEHCGICGEHRRIETRLIDEKNNKVGYSWRVTATIRVPQWKRFLFLYFLCRDDLFVLAKNWRKIEMIQREHTLAEHKFPIFHQYVVKQKRSWSMKCYIQNPIGNTKHTFNFYYNIFNRMFFISFCLTLHANPTDRLEWKTNNKSICT